MDENKRINEIFKWLPIIKNIIAVGGGWKQISGICSPLGLTDTAFRDNPTLGDYLLDENYWRQKRFSA